jgi:hypothetical protein
MARPLRIEYPGAVYHVTSLRNARQSIFIDDVDRQVFLEVLGNVVENTIGYVMPFVCWIIITTSWWKHRIRIFPWECGN